MASSETPPDGGFAAFMEAQAAAETVFNLSLKIGTDPRNISLYEKLFAECVRTGAVDEARIASQSLEVLGAAANPLWSQYRRVATRVPASASTFTEEDWKILRHHDERAGLRDIFAILSPIGLRLKYAAIRISGETPPTDPRLTDRLTSHPHFAEASSRAAELFGFPTQSFSSATGPLDPSVLYVAGKLATYKRLEHLYWFGLPETTELTLLFFGGVVSVSPSSEALAPRPIVQPVKATAKVLQGSMVTAAERESLRDAVEAWLKDGAMVSFERWLGGAERTSIRAGLLLSDDLTTVCSILENGPEQIAGLDRATRVNEALAFASSESHKKLRARFGISTASLESNPHFNAEIIKDWVARLAAVSRSHGPEDVASSLGLSATIDHRGDYPLGPVPPGLESAVVIMYAGKLQHLELCIAPPGLPLADLERLFGPSREHPRVSWDSPYCCSYMAPSPGGGERNIQATYRTVRSPSTVTLRISIVLAS